MKNVIELKREFEACVVKQQADMQVQVDAIDQWWLLQESQQDMLADAMLRKQVKLDQLIDMSQQMVDEGISAFPEFEKEIAELEIEIEMIGNRII